jgi:anthranilate synthase/aminodeoxychorismate synthase-like glutamine amidotransferase
MICLIDNYDSFTYNLYQYVGEMNQEVVVKRNDEVTLEEIQYMSPSHIIISPGPGHPADSGISIELIRKFSDKIPILGVCLGHQAIGLAMGGSIISANEIVHGKQSEISHRKKKIFRGLPKSFQVVRYHSLVVSKEGFPDCLEVLAETEDGTIMALAHKVYPTIGVQFHPESILSEYGKELIRNFLEM